MSRLRSAVRRWFVAAVAVLSGAALLAVLVAATGVLDVSATSGHAPLVEPFLKLAMRRSVAFQSRGIAVPELGETGLIALGAAHFQTGCAHCHGSPVRIESPIYQTLLPPPPALEFEVGDFASRELYWIVRHGLKYTAMPAWSGAGRDDEVWPMVAFLQALPGLEPDDYRRLARGNAADADGGSGVPAVDDGDPVSIAFCTRCHDSAGAGPTSAQVPRLGGQSQAYLEAALRQFRDGARESGYMEPLATNLDDGEIAALAGHFAALQSPVAGPAEAGEGAAAGRRLAQQGDRRRQVPPCEACHAQGRLPIYPQLAGLSAGYLRTQLELWQRGGRIGTPAGRTMAVVAKRLAPAEIEAVAAHYAAEPPPTAPPAGAGD